MTTSPDRCRLCGNLTLVSTGEIALDESGLDPSLVDADEYILWRCTFSSVDEDGEPIACGWTVKRKPDGKASRDPRYTEQVVP
jgi:hypothetical protein